MPALSIAEVGAVLSFEHSTSRNFLQLLQHPVAFVNHFFVAEPDYLDAVLVYYLCPEFIVVLLLFVDAAVYFHHQVELVTVKIGNEAVDYLLAPEAKTVDLVFTGHIPEAPFAKSHVLSEIFGQR
jgi:hypothetical protein